jgi:putative glutamine amidotransferase
MVRKPFIGVALDLHDGYPSRDAIGPGPDCWMDCVRSSGGIPLLLPLALDKADLDQTLDILQGVVYASPRDLEAAEGGSFRHVADEVGETLMRQIAKRGMPFLGIGYGMQLLNFAMGGSVSRLDSTDGGRRHVHPHNPRHALVTKPDSLLARTHDPGGVVNSTHQLVVDWVAPGFRATAHCPGGQVEAIESTHRQWFAVGVQFAPEAVAGLVGDGGLFEALRESAARYEPQVVPLSP